MIIKVSIKDKNTLELQEDAKKGDIIDLNSLSAANIGSVEDAIKNSVKKELEIAMQKEKEDALKIKELELAQKINDERQKIDSKYQQAIKELEDKLNEHKNTIQMHEREKAGIMLNKNIEFENKILLKEQELTKKYEQQIKELENKKNELNTQLISLELSHKDEKNDLINQHKYEIKRMEDEIAVQKDLKSKMSTKMVGETLEQNCEILFEQNIRPALFDKNITFDKDNDITEGTKGDYIYREFDEDNNEILSIMFEMKNESEGGTGKNERFFPKLDSDRKKKNCEYAILVSMLEKENELYNQGIVPIYQYEKMYVIRPNFFIQIIYLLRNASSNSYKYKKELIDLKNKNIDITNFENDLQNFKNDFNRNFRLASDKHNQVIEKLEKQIKEWQLMIDLLKGSDNNLRIANDKLENLNIKRLTKNNPTMANKFKELENKKAEDEKEDEK